MFMWCMTKTNRIHVLMSDEELKALDEWRYANKIASRGEAVRRLVMRGTTPDEGIGRLKRQAVEKDK